LPVYHLPSIQGNVEVQKTKVVFYTNYLTIFNAEVVKNSSTKTNIVPLIKFPICIYPKLKKSKCSVHHEGRSKVTIHHHEEIPILRLPNNFNSIHGSYVSSGPFFPPAIFSLDLSPNLSHPDRNQWQEPRRLHRMR
jgi:hypothetical protein